ncbi:exocyst complex component EXO84 [Cryptococcus bacillisporus CA1873]|uniref:Exocyst complex component EXO84 n=2 Tax=Cryptococcus gattii TaxID=552467 RepID=A0A0D0VQ67_CRYGA|nr:exocyst complex component EXO84 [Cryptococcus bacillisporus CA1280]KIR62560.1 exocyst complex component EXO84 [Cryptococcus bacillisporus CA1873]|eukprot:KIR62560.1 exocyst complex component EXO84 [Cryptococcus gattii CA1873]
MSGTVANWSTLSRFTGEKNIVSIKLKNLMTKGHLLMPSDKYLEKSTKRRGRIARKSKSEERLCGQAIRMGMVLVILDILFQPSGSPWQTRRIFGGLMSTPMS